MKAKNKMNLKQKFLVAIIAITLVVTIALVIYIFIKPKNKVLENNEPINENFAFLLESGDATEVDNFNLINEQRKISEEILNKYKKGKYTITKPLVITDPYEMSPQTALIMFKTNKKEKVTITIKGKHDDDIVVTFAAAKDHFIPVYGLYGGYKNEVVVETESGKSNTLTIETAEIGFTGTVEVLTNKIKNSNGSFYFGTAALGTASIAYDNYGEIRWYLIPDYSKGITMLQNGHLLISDNNVGPDVNSTGGVVEVDMFGFVHHQYDLDGGYHHDAYELENGDLIILTNNNNSNRVEDYIVVLDKDTGKNKRIIDLYEIVSAIDPNLIQEQDVAWGWLNGVSYDKKTNELVLSMRNRNSVIALDYDSLEIKWILGDKAYWSSAFDKYLLTGIGDNFTYTMGQHSPHLDESHNLSIFNNGYDAYKEQTHSCASLKNNASYAMVYKIDEKNMTAEVIYKFGGTEYFSYALSSYNKTYDGNTLFNTGWHFREDVDMDNPSCTQFNNDKYNAYIIEFDKNNEKLVELRIGESKFEVVKANIYNLSLSSVKPNKTTEVANYEFNDKPKSTSNKPNNEYEVLSESEALVYNTDKAEILPTPFSLINNQFSLSGIILPELDYRVTLISTRGKAYRFTLKEANEEMKVSVDLSGIPSGRYYIYVNMGNMIYDTRQYVIL